MQLAPAQEGPIPSTSTPPKSASSMLMKGGVGVFSLRVLALFLAFGADLVLTRSLGTERYGTLAIGISWLSVLITISTLGLSTALNKIIPTERVNGREDLVRGAIHWTSKRILIGSVLIALLFAGGVLLTGDRLSSSLRSVLLIFAALLPIQALSIHRQAVLQALKHPVQALVPEQVIRWVTVLALVGGAYLILGKQLDVALAAWMYGGGILVAFAVAHVWKTRRVAREVAQTAPSFQPAIWWALALPICWNSLMRILNSRADPAMLGWLDSSEGAAFYAIANRLASLLLFGMLAIDAVAAPLIAELYAKGKTAELQRMLNLAAKGLALYALPLGAVLIIGGPWILSLFGEGFEGAYPTLCLLVATRVLTCLVGTVGFLLSMTGHHARVAKVMTASAILKLLLNLALIPTFGAIGAASATFATLAMFSALLYRDVRRELNVDPTLFGCLRSQPTDAS